MVTYRQGTQYRRRRKMTKEGRAKMDERWKPVPGVRGSYEVSDRGNVRNFGTRKPLAPRPTKGGYLRVQINNRDFYIHRLVAGAFCDRPAGCNVINHKDNDRTNNVAENLEWTTQRENVYYAMKQNRMNGFPLPVPVAGTKDGQTRVFRSAHEAERATGCYHKTITRLIKTGGVSRSGYSWKVANAV